MKEERTAVGSHSQDFIKNRLQVKLMHPLEVENSVETLEATAFAFLPQESLGGTKTLTSGLHKIYRQQTGKEVPMKL